MGNGNSSLPPQSQPNSALQVCLNNVFASTPSAVSYPQDMLYQLTAVKPFNKEIPITPAAVVRPSTNQEVAEAVKCAVQSSVKVQARGGGHSYANFCIGGEDGTLVIDLVNFKKFEMNQTTWQATVGGGILLGDLTTLMHDNGGRAMAHGTCPQVGIGGHATIGGLGPPSRMWGSALDHVDEVEVVLADSTIVRANNVTNSDVFWAVKGAGASFGIVTEFVVHTHPEPGDAVRYSYNIQLGSHAASAKIFSTWQSIISDPNLSRKFASQFIIMQLGVIITGTYFGTRDEYEALGIEQKLAQNASVTVTQLDDWLGIVGNWFQTEALQLVGGVSSPFYAKSLTFSRDNLLSESTITNVFNYFDSADKGTLIWFTIFDLAGGAINDIPMNGTAYSHRNALYYMQSYAVGIGSVSDTTRNFLTQLSKMITEASPNTTSYGTYAGYVDPALGSDGPSQYWGSNLPRLQQLKKAIDPNDVFHNPQSVPLPFSSFMATQ